VIGGDFNDRSQKVIGGQVSSAWKYAAHISFMPLITLPKQQSCNSTIMLSINHAFQQRENLATTIEIEWTKCKASLTPTKVNACNAHRMQDNP
jgi:hypothetical protein